MNPNPQTAEFDVDIDDIVRHHTADLDGVTLHYVESGKETGKPVLLLHGFPEFWYSWRYQIVALREAGYRVLAPDQRGYNTSSKPPRIRDYTIDQLVGDVLGLLDHLGLDRVHLVGHDWGGVVAWFAMMLHPERFDRLTIMNMPHPRRMEEGLRTLRQLRKSWYAGFFQIPFLPEKVVAANDYAALRKMFREQVRNNPMTDEQIDPYIKAASVEGALRGMMNWYRAAGRESWKRYYRPIESPVLVIWGVHDTALGEELAEPPADLVSNYRLEKLDASHWVQIDAPDAVNRLLLHFLAEA